jgi:hypothetical protein
MNNLSRLFAGAAAVAAVTVGAAAPAAAQYYPGYGGGGLGDVLVGAVLNSILRGGNPYGYNGYYGRNDYNLERAAVDQCARAAEHRLNGGRGYGSYGGYNSPYGYGYQNAGIRVVQIDRVQRTRNGNMRVYGLATNGAYQGNYGYGYGGYNQPYGGYNQPYGGYNQPYGGYQQASAQYRFSCKFERTGRITDLDISRNRYAYGY